MIIKKILALLMVGHLALIGLIGVARAEVTPETGFIILIENGAGDMKPEVNELLKSYIFRKLHDFASIRHLRDIPVMVVTSRSGKNIWGGTVQELGGRKAIRLQELTKTLPKRCSNLVPSIKAVSESIQMMSRGGTTDIRIISLSTLINVPCGTKEIRLPQSAPSEDLAKMLMRPPVTKVLLFGVHQSQVPIYNEKLRELDKWSQKDGHHFEMFDMTTTDTNLALIGR